MRVGMKIAQFVAEERVSSPTTHEYVVAQKEG